ncbi:MAG: ATP cone domain-containing protein [Gammaproteobacteria bacterium]|nr:ATP cone domain-containing protein [Gammaproteobacteria bacterium]
MGKSDKSGKTLVVDSRTGTRVPYLRGILTRSLQSAGLGFNDAYKLAAWMRRELDDVDEITSDALRAKVAKRLGERHGEEVRDYYLQPEEHVPSVMVREANGQSSPFNSGRLARSLASTTLDVEQAEAVTARIQVQVQRLAVDEVSSDRIRDLVHHDLKTHFGDEIARRYLVWLEFVRSGRPLILLIGGINGVGKSTLAAELAHRLEIVRTQSTDMLREVMRQMTSKQLLPAIHTSSFRAWHVLPSGFRSTADEEDLMVDGFLTQSEQVAVAVEAVLQRALSERVAMIIEGIHIHPAYMQSVPRDGDAIVVPIMLANLDPDQLKKQLRGRAQAATSRRAERYLKNFDTIWQLQSFLLAEADRCHVPILSDWQTVKAVDQAMDMIFSILIRKYPEKSLPSVGAAS